MSQADSRKREQAESIFHWGLGACSSKVLRALGLNAHQPIKAPVFPPTYSSARELGLHAVCQLCQCERCRLTYVFCSTCRG